MAIAVLVTTRAVGAESAARARPEPTRTPAPGKYAAVNGLNMYYEIMGTGRPLVLLHGGMATLDYSFSSVRPWFAKKWLTIAIEQQGHGHTADIDRPLTYEQMADDTAALLGRLQVRKADFLGWSDGGNVALAIAIRHPELVRKLVISGANYTVGGQYPEVVQRIRDAQVAALLPPAADTGPAWLDGDNWPALVAKLKKLWLEFGGFKAEDLQKIEAPVLIMIGDADAVRPEHAVQMFRLLPHAQLAILPGTGHSTLLQRPGWVVTMAEDFLAAPMPPQPAVSGAIAR